MIRTELPCVHIIWNITSGRCVQKKRSKMFVENSDLIIPTKNVACPRPKVRCLFSFFFKKQSRWTRLIQAVTFLGWWARALTFGQVVGDHQLGDKDEAVLNHVEDMCIYIHIYTYFLIIITNYYCLYFYHYHHRYIYIYIYVRQSVSTCPFPFRNDNLPAKTEFECVFQISSGWVHQENPGGWLWFALATLLGNHPNPTRYQEANPWNTVDGRHPENSPVDFGSLAHYFLDGFMHPRWCRISSVNSMTMISSPCNTGCSSQTQVFWSTVHL